MTTATTRAIRDAILSGAFPEGAALRQEALAAELNVSRIPVREALRQLEAEGLVTFNAYQGASVSRLSLDEIRELFELWALIESDLLRRAMPRITEEDLLRAGEILRLSHEALERGEAASWPELSWRFHSALFHPAGRSLSTGILHTIHDNSRRYMYMHHTLAQGARHAAEEHAAILDAARDRDVIRVQVLLRSHILGVGRRLLAHLADARASREASGA